MRKNINLDHFKGFSEKLDALDEYTKSNIIELIWCIRKGKLSITACTYDFESFLNMLHGHHMDHIEQHVNPKADGWAVDLESLDDLNMGKYYEWYKNRDIVATGFNLTEDGIFEVKNYYQREEYVRATLIEGEYLKIDTGIEEMVSSNDWPGPKELIDICKEQKLWMGFSSKKEKDQWYMRIRDIGIL